MFLKKGGGIVEHVSDDYGSFEECKAGMEALIRKHRRRITDGKVYRRRPACYGSCSTMVYHVVV